SFNADQEKLQKMQVDARNYMDNMTRSAQNEALMNSQQLRDSVDKYIAEYSKKQGYTLVLRKAATWYVGDIDDITADVVKGLNARYNKVDTKK
ncbi:MAG: OmpH family outer membrane protein, partial [Bacteroidales bacterium]|nr:OmpH family outer membrane protein [Bacteroidales bacterium]